jgi:hypothetical protein
VTVKLPTYNYVDISTGHITAADNKILTENAGLGDFPMSVCAYPYGYFIPLGDFSTMELTIKELLALGMSEQFANLLRLCVEANAMILRIDCDAEKCADLPAFEW